jgi:hypothetical protein
MTHFCKSREVHVWSKHIIDARGKSLSFLERDGRILSLKFGFTDGGETNSFWTKSFMRMNRLPVQDLCKPSIYSFSGKRFPLFA